MPGIRCLVASDPASSVGGSWSNGNGQHMREYSVLLFYQLVGQPKPPHLTLSFTLPLALWGRVFLYCCSAGASQPLLKSTAGRGTLQQGFNTPSMGLFEVGSSVGTCCLLGSLPPHCVAGWTCSFWPYLFFFTSKNIFTSEALKFLSHRQHKAKNLLK